MSRYATQPAELAEKMAHDKNMEQLAAKSERRERLGEAFPPDPYPPLPGVAFMVPEQWKERLHLVEAFVRQGFLWQWHGERIGWRKETDSNFAADPREYSIEFREDSPWEEKP